MYLDLPSHLVADLLSGSLWPGHPLGRPLTGTMKTVAGISRGDLLDYKRSFYTPANMVLVACGKLCHDSLVKKCSGEHSSWIGIGQ